MDVSANLGYSLGTYGKFDLSGNYRKQEGRGVKLDLKTLKGEYNIKFRQLYLEFGMEWYARVFYGEKINYLNSFIRISRKL